MLLRKSGLVTFLNFRCSSRRVVCGVTLAVCEKWLITQVISSHTSNKQVECSCFCHYIPRSLAVQEWSSSEAPSPPRSFLLAGRWLVDSFWRWFTSANHRPMKSVRTSYIQHMKFIMSKFHSWVGEVMVERCFVSRWIEPCRMAPTSVFSTSPPMNCYCWLIRQLPAALEPHKCSPWSCRRVSIAPFLLLHLGIKVLA